MYNFAFHNSVFSGSRKTLSPALCHVGHVGHIISLIYDPTSSIPGIHRPKNQEFEVGLDILTSTLSVSFLEWVLLIPMTLESTEFENLVPIEKIFPRSYIERIQLNL